MQPFPFFGNGCVRCVGLKRRRSLCAFRKLRPEHESRAARQAEAAHWQRSVETGLDLVRDRRAEASACGGPQFASASCVLSQASTRMRSRDSACRSPPPHAAERQVSPAGSTCLLPPSANRCRHFRFRQGSAGCPLFLSDNIAPTRPRRGRRAEASACGGPHLSTRVLRRLRPENNVCYRRPNDSIPQGIGSPAFQRVRAPQASTRITFARGPPPIPQEKTASSHRRGCGRFVRTTRDYQPFRMFSATAATSRSRASTEAQAVWGVSDSRSGCRIPSSGLSAGSGSTA